MDFKEATKFLKFNRETHEISNVSETANYFVFTIVPIGSTGPGSFKPPTAVSKRTGAVSIFNPMRVGREEMKTLKHVWPKP